MSDPLDRWRRAADASDGALLEASGAAALTQPPGPGPLRELAVAAGALERRAPLDPDARARALTHVRWGLAADRGEAVRWDAVHVAAELALAELAPEVRAVLGGAGGASAPVRARAAEAWPRLAPPADARTALEAARAADADWTVRRLAGDALRALEARGAARRPAPLARLEALLRCGQVRVEGGSATLPVAALEEAGLDLPPTYRLLLATCCGPGRLLQEAEDGRGPAAALTLAPLAALRDGLAKAGPGAAELRRIQEHVWARYVDGGKGTGLDEGRALRALGERYDGGLVDADLWSLGVLLFEAAAVEADPRRQAALRRRCRSALRAFRELAPEPWEVVDDRLAEVEQALEQDAPPDEPGPLLAFADRGGEPLLLDLHRPGVFVREGTRVRRLAPSLAHLVADPLGHLPAGAAGAGQGKGVLSLLDEADGHLAAGRYKQAGRLFGDALEADASDAVLARAAALLSRPDLSPLLAAQLLATVPLAGDARSGEVVRRALQALAPGRARDLVEVLGPYDEDGSQYALVVDAAAALRARSHQDARDVARRFKQGRGKPNLRSIRNPFYK